MVWVRAWRCTAVGDEDMCWDGAVEVGCGVSAVSGAKRIGNQGCTVRGDAAAYLPKTMGWDVS